MRMMRILPALALFVLASCASVHVASDYDKKVDFSSYRTYAFFKNGIDKVEISDLDKRRILHAVEEELKAKGLSPSDNPDLLINFFTKSTEQVNVNPNGWGYGFGWGWSPYMWGGGASVYTNTHGTLFIDLIDAKRKELVWQGEGTGVLTQNSEKKEERIKEFVSRIMAQYPPQIKK